MSIPKRVLSEIKLLVFDLDGTLIDSELDLALSVNALRGRMGLAPLPHDLIASYVGRGVTHLVRQALGDHATEENLESAQAFFLDYYRGHMLDHTLPYPGVAEALDDLRGRNLAVLTNKPVRFSRDILAGLGLAPYFSFIYGGNSFDRKKPDPMGLRKLMDDTGVSPQKTIMIGDSDTDVLTGRNAAVWTCGVSYGFGAHTLESTPPDLLVDDLRDLTLLVNNTVGGVQQEAGSTA